VVDQLRDGIRARCHEIADRIAALVPAEAVALAREMTILEHALLELAPSAALLDARVSQECDGVIMSLLIQAPA
jgi:hypothetical protein